MYKREIIGIMLALFMAAAFFGCGKINSIPEELLGIWETSEPKYEGTYFELGLNTLTFKDIEGKIVDYMITSIKRKKSKGNDWYEYTLKYKSLETKKMEFSFYHDPAEDGTLRFKNQELVVWHKRASD